jgi:hypothetical protein
MVLASYSVCADRIILASILVGVWVPLSDPFLAKSMKSLAPLLSSWSVTFALVDGVTGGRILLLPGDGGGTYNPCVAGSIPGRQAMLLVRS